MFGVISDGAGLVLTARPRFKGLWKERRLRRYCNSARIWRVQKHENRDETAVLDSETADSESEMALCFPKWIFGLWIRVWDVCLFPKLPFWSPKRLFRKPKRLLYRLKQTLRSPSKPFRTPKLLFETVKVFSSSSGFMNFAAPGLQKHVGVQQSL